MSKQRLTFSAELKREASALVRIKAIAISRPAVRSAPWIRHCGARIVCRF